MSSAGDRLRLYAQDVYTPGMSWPVEAWEALRALLEERDRLVEAVKGMPREYANTHLRAENVRLQERLARVEGAVDAAVIYDKETRDETGEKCPECQEPGGKHLMECPWFALRDALEGE